MSHLFIVSVRTPFRLVRNRTWHSSLTPSLPMKLVILIFGARKGPLIWARRTHGGCEWCPGTAVTAWRRQKYQADRWNRIWRQRKGEQNVTFHYAIHQRPKLILTKFLIFLSLWYLSKKEIVILVNYFTQNMTSAKGRKIHTGLSRQFCPIKFPPFRKFGRSSQFFGDIHGFRIFRVLISCFTIIISCFPDIFPKISPDSRRNFLWKRPLILDT